MYWAKLNTCPAIGAHWCLTQKTWLYSWILFYVLGNLSLQLGRFCCFWFGGLMRVCVVTFLRCSSCLRVRLQIPPKVNHGFFGQRSQCSGCGLSAEVKHLVHMHKAVGSTLSTTKKRSKSPTTTKHLDDNTCRKLDILSSVNLFLVEKNNESSVRIYLSRTDHLLTHLWLVLLMYNWI